MEGYPTADLSNIQVFDGTEPRISVIEQPYLGILPLLDFVSRPTIPFGFEVPRYHGSNQRHSTEFTPQSRSSSVAPLGPSPGVRSGGHGNGLGGHVVQQTVRPATPSSPYPPTGRRIQMRAFSIASSIAASYTAEDREPRDISLARAANMQNNNIPSRDNSSRRAHQQYPYPLGWDTQWRPSAERGTLRSQRNQGYSSYPSRSTSELPPGFPSENGYPPSDRTHPFL
ncbi:uncharacterized protein C2845_PM04G22380 [Panicum miliaceum]|uniref:Uncharacterized protein n=1 Tax=Panicum miliaceum TaxID=4540 RepID=A0A3L6QWH8_PANMI|nr:uncharacterized protein C2845_PM04G22380 [Panicum miliaceum]